MSQLHAIFEQILTDHLRGLQAACPQPAPVEAEEPRFSDEAVCDCGGTRTVLRDDCDPSTGYYDRIECCTSCGARVD